MLLATGVIAMAVLHGVYGVSVESGAISMEEGDFLLEWTRRVELLEVKVQKMDKLEARVEHLERVIREQNARAQSQSRKLAVFEQLLKRSTQVRVQTKDAVEGLTYVDTRSNSSDAAEASEPDVPRSNAQTNGGSAHSGHLSTARRGIRAAPAGVAFSAVLDHSIGPLGEHQVVVFNNVKLNDGNGYNKYSGSFICPTAGVYLFLYSMGHTGSGQVLLELMVNGQKVNAGTVQPFHVNQELQGGNSAIVRLAAGDTVWLDAFGTSGYDHDDKLDGGFLTTFSGVLLY